MTVATNRDSAVNNKYDSTLTLPENHKERHSYAKSQMGCSQKPSPGLAPSTDHDVWLKWKEDGHTKVKSSRVSPLTPHSSSGEMFDERYDGEATTHKSAKQLDPDLSHGGCSH